MSVLVADHAADRLAIREAIENWMIWRDSGDWDRFATLWHPEGRMHATWFQASASEFIARSRAAFDSGLAVIHQMHGSSIDIAGNRAVSQTRSTILQRGEVHGVLVDVACAGRFWDAWERVGDAWLLRLRQPIYELDHMVPVHGGPGPALDSALLASFPAGYRNLAYLQTQLGLDVFASMPGARGPELDVLMARGRAWLAGEPAACLA